MQLQNDASNQGKEFVWRFSRMDIEHTVGEAVKRLTSEAGVSKDTLVLRCDALEALGYIFRDKEKKPKNAKVGPGILSHFFPRDNELRRARSQKENIFSGIGHNYRPGDVARIDELKQARE